MRIAFDAKRYFHNKTGLGNYSRKLISALSTFYPNHEYYLCDSKPDESFMRPLAHCEILRSEKNYIPDTFWRTYSIADDLKHKNIALYHGLSNEIPWSLKKNGIKSVVTIHDIIHKLYPNYYPLIDRIIYDRKVSFACKNADVILTTSHQTKNDLAIYYNVNPERVQVVYQSVVMPEVNEQQLAEAKDRHNLKTPYFLYVGRIEERKNLLTALKAFKKLNNRELSFYVVGQGGAYKELCETFAQDELPGQVTFFSGIDNVDLCAFYKYSIALIFASHYEGFGIPIIEAQILRTPVITSQYGCFREIASVAAIYVNPNNIDQLSETMKTIYSDSGLRNELQQAGQENAKRFTPESFANELMSAYEKLFNR